MRMTKRLVAVAMLGALPSCMTTGLVDWANTRDEPVMEHIRVEVALLFILPALAADVALLPVQMLAQMPPYDGMRGSPAPDNHPRSAEDERYLRSTSGR